ncbi:MAG TPA: GGDEF domain-containing protein, partial [Bacillota bacterium]|nr:GGDEF domain-containing protein [Bacillota bacterium]
IIYGISLELPCAAISVLLVVMNKIQSGISLDALTGLNNRRSLERYLSKYPHGRPITVLFLDVNYFKLINDKYGHNEGDNALIATGEVLRQVCGKSSVFLSRYGGDEFLLVIPFDEQLTASEFEDMLQRALDDMNAAGTLPYELSVSIGSASVDNANEKTLPECIKRADDNMYSRKKSFHLKK